MTRNNDWNFDTTYSIGDILYANTTSTLSKLPIGTSNQILTVTSGLPSWQNANSGPINNLNFTNADDFLTGVNGISQSSWDTAGIVALFAGFADDEHPGIFIFETGTTTTGSGNLLYGMMTSSNRSGAYLFGGGIYTFDMILQIPNLSTVGNRYTIRIGYQDNDSSSTVTNGCWFQYSDNVNSGNWQVLTRKSSTTTTSNTSNVVDTDWHKYSIVVNANASSVSFYIDDVEVSSGAITTNIPSSAGEEVGLVLTIIKSSGTTSRNVLFDYSSHNIQLTNSRY